jgi:hypothetical protein
MAELATRTRIPKQPEVGTLSPCVAHTRWYGERQTARVAFPEKMGAYLSEMVFKKGSNV